MLILKNTPISTLKAKSLSTRTKKRTRFVPSVQTQRHCIEVFSNLNVKCTVVSIMELHCYKQFSSTRFLKIFSFLLRSELFLPWRRAGARSSAAQFLWTASIIPRIIAVFVLCQFYRPPFVKKYLYVQKSRICMVSVRNQQNRL